MNSFPGITDAPGFDEPLEMLLACHGRIWSQCATLEKLNKHLPEHGCDQQAQQAAGAILRYFDTAGRNHHKDEECDLFPVLHGTGDVAAQRLVTHLLERHVVLDAAWDELRGELQEILSSQSARLTPHVVQNLIRAYRTHIEMENAQLLPMAKRLMTPAQLATLGRSMSQRRGVTFPQSA